LTANPDSDNILLVAKDPQTREEEVLTSLRDQQVSQVISVAGGWTGGKIDDKNFWSGFSNMSASCLESALLAARVAVASKASLLVLTGAAAALSPQPDMLSYGLTKNAVHYLVRSLKDSVHTVAVLPSVLDTESNRKWMTGSRDHWTPLDFVSNLLLQWTREPPESGSLIQLKTKEGVTQLVTN